MQLNMNVRLDAIDVRYDAINVRLDGRFVRDANSTTKTWNRRAIFSPPGNTLRAVRKTRPGWGPGLPAHQRQKAALRVQCL
jgi:hypothetical protein